MRWNDCWLLKHTKIVVTHTQEVKIKCIFDDCELKGVLMSDFPSLCFHSVTGCFGYISVLQLNVYIDPCQRGAPATLTFVSSYQVFKGALINIFLLIIDKKWLCIMWKRCFDGRSHRYLSPDSSVLLCLSFVASFSWLFWCYGPQLYCIDSFHCFRLTRECFCCKKSSKSLSCTNFSADSCS